MGYDLLNHKFPNPMDMINCPLGPKLLMDLANIEDALPRAAGGSGARRVAVWDGGSGFPVEGLDYCWRELMLLLVCSFVQVLVLTSGGTCRTECSGVPRCSQEHIFEMQHFVN